MIHTRWGYCDIDATGTILDEAEYEDCGCSAGEDHWWNEKL